MLLCGMVTSMTQGTFRKEIEMAHDSAHEDPVFRIRDVQNSLVAYFKGASEYRRETDNKDKSWEVHHKQYAKSLRCVANYVATLPDDDIRLRRLARCRWLFSSDGTQVMAPYDTDGESDTKEFTLLCLLSWEAKKSKEARLCECSAWFKRWAEIAIEEHRLFNEAQDNAGEVCDDFPVGYEREIDTYDPRESEKFLVFTAELFAKYKNDRKTLDDAVCRIPDRPNTVAIDELWEEFELTLTPASQSLREGLEGLRTFALEHPDRLRAIQEKFLGELDG